jgi:hypothetical protein
VAFDKPVFFKDLIGLIASAVLAPGAQPRTLEVRAYHDLFICLFFFFLHVWHDQDSLCSRVVVMRSVCMTEMVMMMTMKLLMMMLVIIIMLLLSCNVVLIAIAATGAAC